MVILLEDIAYQLSRVYKLCSESLLNSFFGIIPSSKDDFVSNPIDSHNVKVKAGGIISFKDTRSLPRNKTQKSLSSDNIIAFYFGIWLLDRCFEEIMFANTLCSIDHERFRLKRDQYSRRIIQYTAHKTLLPTSAVVPLSK